MKKTTIPLIILLIVSLIGGLMLVKQSQDTRKGASFSNTKLILLPSEKIIKRVGEVVSVKIYFQTESGAKVDGVQTKVCYGKELNLTNSGVVVNTEAGFGNIPIFAVGETSPTQNCSTIVVTSQLSAEYLTTTAEAMSLNFTAVSTGSGEIVIDKDKSMITGDNTASATDKEIAITSVENTTYQIIGEAASCNVDADCESGEYCYQPPMPVCPVGQSCIDLMPRKYCKEIECNLSINPPINCPEGYSCVTDDLNGANGECVLDDTDGAPVFNYKVTFGGVIVNQDTKCAVNWPLQIIMLAAGETKIYTDTPTAITSGGKLIEYRGSLTLNGFNHLSNVAAFLKGPKHLQSKYAIQDQSAKYDKAGGKLTFTTSAETSPLYNFTGYPMLAGDVVGTTVNDAPNGEINGVDFAYLKSLPKNVLEGVGTNVKGDLDGNCMITSNDVAIFRISLEAKQGELY